MINLFPDLKKKSFIIGGILLIDQKTVKRKICNTRDFLIQESDRSKEIWVRDKRDNYKHLGDIFTSKFLNITIYKYIFY